MFLNFYENQKTHTKIVENQDEHWCARLFDLTQEQMIEMKQTNTHKHTHKHNVNVIAHGNRFRIQQWWVLAVCLIVRWGPIRALIQS